MADAIHAHAPAAQQTVILERLARLLAVAGRDAALHHRLCQSPKAVLAEAGLAVADGVQVTIRITDPADAAAIAEATTPDHLILPVPPLAGQDALSDADLDHVSGGNRFYDQVQTFGPSFTTGIPGIFGLR